MPSELEQAIAHLELHGYEPVFWGGTGHIMHREWMHSFYKGRIGFGKRDWEVANKLPTTRPSDWADLPSGLIVWAYRVLLQEANHVRANA